MEPLPYLKRISLRRDTIESFASYPFNIPAISQLESLELGKEMTIFVGENGSGKSTLIEAIAIGMGFNAEGGTKNFNFGTRRSHSELHRYLRLARSFKKHRDGFFLRAESFYNVATNIDELDEEPAPAPLIRESYGGVSLHKQSHGESFLSLLIHRMGGDGLYIFDEPESALSPSRQLTVLARIHELIQQDSQFVIATHSPILMSYPGALIYQVSEKGFERIAYEDTENYRITKHFLNNPEGMIKSLFSGTDLDD